MFAMLLFQPPAAAHSNGTLLDTTLQALEKVAELPHMLSFYPKASKSSLLLLYRQPFSKGVEVELISLYELWFLRYRSVLKIAIF